MITRTDLDVAMAIFGVFFIFKEILDIIVYSSDEPEDKVGLFTVSQILGVPYLIWTIVGIFIPGWRICCGIIVALSLVHGTWQTQHFLKTGHRYTPTAILDAVFCIGLISVTSAQQVNWL